MTLAMLKTDKMALVTTAFFFCIPSREYGTYSTLHSISAVASVSNCLGNFNRIQRCKSLPTGCRAEISCTVDKAFALQTIFVQKLCRTASEMKQAPAT